MANSNLSIHGGHVAKPNSIDRDVIKQLHDLGNSFQKAVGAYVSDNPNKFPSGTLTNMLTAEERKKVAGLTNDRSHVNPETMSVQEMDDHGIYYGVHLYCMYMQVQERYLASLKVPFKAIVDSINVDVSNEATVKQKLDACERYGFEPMAQLLKLKCAP